MSRYDPFRTPPTLAKATQAELWMAAAKGACRNGDHAGERRCRNTARLILGRRPLTGGARCLYPRKD